MLLEKGRIAAIGSSLSHDEAEVVDGSGKYLIPGPGETEGHITRYSSGRRSDMTLRWPEEGDATRLESNLRSYLANGFTTVVDLGGPTEALAGAAHRAPDARRVPDRRGQGRSPTSARSRASSRAAASTTPRR